MALSRKSEYGMTKSHIKLLSKNRLKLARNLDLSELLQYLVQEEILTDRMIEKITKHSTTFGQNVAFLNLLPTRGPKAFDEFIKALKDSHQDHLANLLLESMIGSSARPQQTLPSENVPQQVLPSENVVEINNDSLHSELINQENINAISHDTTDGSSMMTVDKTSMEFYRSNFQKSYKMISKPLGFALIISITKFQKEVDLQERHGGNLDKDNLTSVLCHLGFETSLVENQTAQEINAALKQFAEKPDHASCDSCLVALLSHGEEGVIYGNDGESLEIEKIVSMFDNANCPLLRNKPKIFFIQSCRGKNQGVGIDMSDGRVKNCEIENYVSCKTRLPKRSDMVIGYATLQGHTAMRNTSHGSWYIEALVKVLAKYSKSKDLTEMLTIVNSIIKGRESNCNENIKVMSVYQSTLCKRLYFFPGITQKCK